jgi:hypothetical protein
MQDSLNAVRESNHDISSKCQIKKASIFTSQHISLNSNVYQIGLPWPVFAVLNPQKVEKGLTISRLVIYIIKELHVQISGFFINVLCISF